MKINGYKLRETVQKWELRRDTALTQFNESLWKFEGQDVTSPADVAKTIVEAETAITKLQTAQLALNLHVKVDVLGKSITLTEAIKATGGAERVVQMWKGVAKQSASSRGYDPYGRGDGLTREKDKQYATRTVAPKDAVKYATEAGTYAVALRTAVSKGNAVEVETDKLAVELSAALFE